MEPTRHVFLSPNLPPPSGDAKTAVFDPEDLIFRMMGHEDLARVVAAGFIDDLPRQFASLAAAAESGYAAAVAAAAHAIKGASANAAAPGLYQLSSRIEKLAAAGTMPLELLPELSTAIQLLEAPIRAFLAA